MLEARQEAPDVNFNRRPNPRTRCDASRSNGNQTSVGSDRTLTVKAANRWDAPTDGPPEPTASLPSIDGSDERSPQAERTITEHKAAGHRVRAKPPTCTTKL